MTEQTPQEPPPAPLPTEQRTVALPPPRRRGPALLTLAAAGAVVVAAVLVAWAVVAWAFANQDRSDANDAKARASAELARLHSDEALLLARARAEASRDGRHAIALLNTIDYRAPGDALDAWESVTTGPLLEELRQSRQSNEDAVERSGTVTTAEVVRIAVTELAERDGTATVIAAVRLNTTANGRAQQVKYNRIEGTLDRTQDGWKLSELTVVSPTR